MNTVPRWFVSTALCLSVTALLGAQTQSPARTRAQAPPAAARTPPLALNVKMGLWQMSISSTLGGDMGAMTGGMDMSKLTPEQQAQMAAAMKNMMGTHTDVHKSCLTRDQFNLEQMLAGTPQDCTQKINANTATALDATVTCTGEQASTSKVHFVATSPTTVTGTVNSTMTEQGKTMTMDMKLAGTWLGADCGDVK